MSYRHPAARGRRDANHAAIAQVFRQFGWQWKDTYRVGEGFPDGVALSPDHYVYLIEIKTPKGPIEDSQVKFLADGWPVRYLRSEAEAINFCQSYVLQSVIAVQKRAFR